MGKDKERNELFKNAYKQKMKSKAKERKQSLKEKRARLIVKNLPFHATPHAVQAHFEKYGKVTNVELLKKDDDKLVGCGFVQFEAVQKAAKARHHLNGKPFLGRVIECEFSMAKKKFEKKVHQEKKKQFWEMEKIKDDIQDNNDNNQSEDVKEEDVHSLSDSDEENVDEPVDISQLSNDDNEDNSEDDDSSDNDSGMEIDEVKEEKPTIEPLKKRFESHDTTEGKTIFVKNLPFEATNQDLKECMLQFGPVYYALVCIDKMTEHSKGTGFVKFRNKEDADRCLQAGTELTCLGTILDCHAAIGRQEMQNKSESKEKEKQRDSRNLYLIKEGVILAGSKAAEGVSASDMAKRLQLEQYKTQMLRNLNMFISRTRLIIHNLPATWDDNKLRILLKKHAGPGAVIREARIMRNMQSVDANGVGISKEHGFVMFTTHEHALNALRSLNNNPRIFSENKRPIVAFSIENRVMVNAKQKRLEKSRQLNPLSKQFDANAKKEHHQRKFDKAVKETETEVIDGADFSGAKAKMGQTQKMRSRFKLTTQAKLHHEKLKEAKKQKKNVGKTLEQKKESFIRQGGQKINKQKRDREAKDDSFAKMVNSYKSKLLKNDNSNKTRGAWAES